MSTWYVDALATSGDTSGNGSETYPWQTISHAISTAVSGDTIVVAAGVYRETLSVNKNLVVYGRGMVIVDGETLRVCVSTAASAVSLNIIFQNIIFRNGSTAIVEYVDASYDIAFINCTFYQDTTAVAVPVVSTATYSAPISVSFLHCTIHHVSTVVYLQGTAYIQGSLVITALAPYAYVRLIDCIVDVTHTQQYAVSSITVTKNPACAPDVSYVLSSLGQVEGAANTQTIQVTIAGMPWGSTYVCAGVDLVNCSHLAAAGTVNAYRIVNVTTTPPPYTTDTYPDPTLYLNRSGPNIASYLGAGTNKGNIGSEWYPVYGWDSDVSLLPAALSAYMPAWRDPVSAVEYVTDPNYVDGVTKGPAVRVNDSNGDHWEIDTMTQPGATSCKVVGPVVKIPVRTGAPVTIKAAIRQCVEDLTLAAGSRKVMDSTILDATRTECYRASVTPFGQTAASGGAVPAWVDVNFTSDYTETFTQTFYLQLGFILTTVGQ